MDKKQKKGKGKAQQPAAEKPKEEAKQPAKP